MEKVPQEKGTDPLPLAIVPAPSVPKAVLIGETHESQTLSSTPLPVWMSAKNMIVWNMFEGDKKMVFEIEREDAWKRQDTWS